MDEYVKELARLSLQNEAFVKHSHIKERLEQVLNRQVVIVNKDEKTIANKLKYDSYNYALHPNVLS